MRVGRPTHRFAPVRADPEEELRFQRDLARLQQGDSESREDRELTTVTEPADEGTILEELLLWDPDDGHNHDGTPEGGRQVSGSSLTYTGLTVGDVLTATSSTTASFESPAAAGGAGYDDSKSGTVTTTDATPIVVLSEEFAADGAYVVQLFVVAHQQSMSNNAGGYGIALTVAREGSTISIVDQDPLWTPHENTSAWDVAVTTDGSVQVDVTVTGSSSTTVKWRALMLITRILD